MKKYQWNNEALHKKSQLYDWLMILVGVITIGCILLVVNFPTLLLVVLLACAAVCFGLSWRLKKQDANLRKPQPTKG